MESDDILDVMAKIAALFRSVNMKPPTAILLGSHDEGMRFLSAVRQNVSPIFFVGSPDLGRPIEMADGSVWMECKVMDIAVRWPSTKYATPDGSWSYT